MEKLKSVTANENPKNIDEVKMVMRQIWTVPNVSKGGI